MTKVLIVGIDGFLGRSLFNRFSTNTSVEVFGSSRIKSSPLYLDLNVESNISFSEFDVVILLSSITSDKACHEQPDLAYQTNVTSTISLLEKCVGCGCYCIFLSSNSVFNGSKSFYSYQDPVSPRNKYAELKVHVERWISCYFPERISILRLTKVLPDSALPFFAKRWVDEINDFGFTEVIANHFLSPITEDKVFSALTQLVLSKKPGIFHLGSSIEYSYSDYAKNLIIQYDLPPQSFRFVFKGQSNVYNSLETNLSL
tara:strand:- start:8 stop:781 length:774 start_codon:yes stop_codon:yes gene_type:complete